MTDEVREPITTPLVGEAVKKAAVAWVSIAGAPAYAVWCTPLDEALYVISGPGEQTAPGLAEAGLAEVTLRGDHGGRIVTWPAVVTRVEPGSSEWESKASQVALKRLNAAASGTELAEHWAAVGCVLNRLSPADVPLAAGDTLPDGSLAESPRPTPATRPTRRPFRLHRVRRD